MGTILFFAVLVGLDNLQVGAGLGLAGVRSVRRGTLALAFGACEALMPLVGLSIGHLLHGALGEAVGVLGPLVLAVCGALIIAMSLREREAESVMDRRWLLLGLPLTLSLDNLLAGVGLGALGYPVLLSAAVVGGISGAMCLLGLYLGARVRRWVPARPDLLSGTYLVIVAVALLLLDVS